jgi:hypothetical protein
LRKQIERATLGSEKRNIDRNACDRYRDDFNITVPQPFGLSLRDRSGKSRNRGVLTIEVVA